MLIVQIILFLNFVFATTTILVPQNVCEDNVCKDVYYGLVMIESSTSQEVVVNKTIEKGDLTGDTVNVTIRLTKSPLYIAYNLIYYASTYGRMTEDIKKYTWTDSSVWTNYHSHDWNSESCNKKEDVAQFVNMNNKNADLVKTLLMSGKVCACDVPEFIPITARWIQRADVDCNAWAAVYWGWRTNWASRHCIRLSGGIYDIYKLGIGTPVFEINLNLTLKYSSGLEIVRNYTMSANSKAVYDDELDFNFQIETSADTMGTSPPSLYGLKYLVLPQKNSSSIDEGLMLDITEVDLSGADCNKVGTSIFAWANDYTYDVATTMSAALELYSLNDETYVTSYAYASASNEKVNLKSYYLANSDFCKQKHGSCTNNNPLDIYERDVKLLADNSDAAVHILRKQNLDDWSYNEPELVANVSSEAFGSIFNDGSPQSIRWASHKSHTTSLSVTLNADSLELYPLVSTGTITNIIIAGESNENNKITINVNNTGDKLGTFSVSIPSCDLISEQWLLYPQNANITYSPSIISGASSTMDIQPNSVQTITIDLFRRVGLGEATYNCTVNLRNVRNKILDEAFLSVIFLERDNDNTSIDPPSPPNNPDEGKDEVINDSGTCQFWNLFCWISFSFWWVWDIFAHIKDNIVKAIIIIVVLVLLIVFFKPICKFIGYLFHLLHSGSKKIGKKASNLFKRKEQSNLKNYASDIESNQAPPSVVILADNAYRQSNANTSSIYNANQYLTTAIPQGNMQHNSHRNINNMQYQNGINYNSMQSSTEFNTYNNAGYQDNINNDFNSNNENKANKNYNSTIDYSPYDSNITINQLKPNNEYNKDTEIKQFTNDNNITNNTQLNYTNIDALSHQNEDSKTKQIEQILNEFPKENELDLGLNRNANKWYIMHNYKIDIKTSIVSTMFLANQIKTIPNNKNYIAIIYFMYEYLKKLVNVNIPTKKDTENMLIFKQITNKLMSLLSDTLKTGKEYSLFEIKNILELQTEANFDLDKLNLDYINSKLELTQMYIDDQVQKIEKKIKNKSEKELETFEKKNPAT